MTKNITYYESKEERLNVITHAIGLILSIIALVLLVVYSSIYGSA
jgi:hemolysin III